MSGQAIWPENKKINHMKINRITIIGGGNLGTSIAKKDRPVFSIFSKKVSMSLMVII
jgi:hypothetical protein